MSARSDCKNTLLMCSTIIPGHTTRLHLFLAAVAQGMAVADALVSSGYDDKCFFPENAVLGPVADSIHLMHGAERRVVRGCKGESDVTLFALSRRRCDCRLDIKTGTICAHGGWRGFAGTLVVLSLCQTSSRCRGTRKGGTSSDDNPDVTCHSTGGSTGGVGD